ncbi:hypothetical protein GCM10009546_33580 [Actinomadura livida]|uniref:Uncharacterized protein n=1 Tax=Actinomadura livida TaxID=79909 RepID=A0ABP3PIE1_9ACTN|nr:hypothetical protein GCM10010208_42580 [Actinomadura livida]
MAVAPDMKPPPTVGIAPVPDGPPGEGAASGMCPAPAPDRAPAPGRGGVPGMDGGSGAVWDGPAKSGAADGSAFPAQEGVGGGTISVRSPRTSAEPGAAASATGAGSGVPGPTGPTE